MSQPLVSQICINLCLQGACRPQRGIGQCKSEETTRMWHILDFTPWYKLSYREERIVIHVDCSVFQVQRNKSTCAIDEVANQGLSVGTTARKVALSQKPTREFSIFGLVMIEIPLFFSRSNYWLIQKDGIIAKSALAYIFRSNSDLFEPIKFRSLKEWKIRSSFFREYGPASRKGNRMKKTQSSSSLHSPPLKNSVLIRIHCNYWRLDFLQCFQFIQDVPKMSTPNNATLDPDFPRFE